MTKGITLQELDATLVSTLATKDEIGKLSDLPTTAKDNVVNAVKELFTSASNGKTSIAAAITGKNVPASGSDTFEVLVQKIKQISSGISGVVDEIDRWNARKLLLTNEPYRQITRTCVLKNNSFWMHWTGSDDRSVVRLLNSDNTVIREFIVNEGFPGSWGTIDIAAAAQGNDQSVYVLAWIKLDEILGLFKYSSGGRLVWRREIAEKGFSRLNHKLAVSDDGTQCVAVVETASSDGWSAHKIMRFNSAGILLGETYFPDAIKNWNFQNRDSLGWDESQQKFVILSFTYTFFAVIDLLGTVTDSGSGSPTFLKGLARDMYTYFVLNKYVHSSLGG